MKIDKAHDQFLSHKRLRIGDTVRSVYPHQGWSLHQLSARIYRLSRFMPLASHYQQQCL